MEYSNFIKELEGGEIVIIRLNDSYPIKPFDCGIDDLNDFLFNDAKTHLKYLSAYGKHILQLIIMSFLTNNKTGCKFLTVDALNNIDTLRFYEKNGFSFVTLSDYNKLSRQMYKNLIILKQLENL